MKKRRIVISDDEEEEEEREERERNKNKIRNEIIILDDDEEEKEEKEQEEEEKKESYEINKRRKFPSNIELTSLNTIPINSSTNITNKKENFLLNFINHIKRCQNESIQIIKNKRNLLFNESKNYFINENFESIKTKDLSKLFTLIDKYYFNNSLYRVLIAEKHKITFRISQRMTSRAGQLLTDLRKPNEHELAISSYLLFKTFSNQHNILESEVNEREIKVNGIRCHNRLDCLLRIIEHEIVHLILSCGTIVEAIQTSILRKNPKNHNRNSRNNNYDNYDEDDNDEDEDNEHGNKSKRKNKIGCVSDETYHGPTFQLLVRVLFGHTECTHDLITQDEIAYSLYNITVGSKVKFEFDGVKYTGKVNRVQKRVTVLVKDDNKNNPHPDSREFSDGNFYRKFYVPIDRCRAVGS